MRKIFFILALTVTFVGLASKVEARWYQAQQGRWASRDPIGIEGGRNLYTYVKNSPTNFADPSGLVHCTFNLTSHIIICSSNDGKRNWTFPNSQAGNGPWTNDSASECLPDKGPLPRGLWNMTTSSATRGLFRINLDPVTNAKTKTCRMNIQFHGSSSSKGCAANGFKAPVSNPMMQEIYDYAQKEGGTFYVY